jgi:hypothetical protein
MNKKIWLLIIGLVVLLCLSACQGNMEATSEEVAEVPTQVPTEIPTQIPTEIPAEVPADNPEVETSVEEVSTEQEVAAESTTEEIAVGPLFDPEEMLKRLGTYVLRPDDMPHSYVMAGDGERHLTTLRLINEMGELEAKMYIKSTGRIDGWWSTFKRTSKEDFAPGTFESSVELFETPEGALAAMSPEYYAIHKDETREYNLVEDGCDIGDYCEIYYSEVKDPATEVVTAQYNVAFTYRNAFAWVMARGLIVDLEADYVMDAARAVLAKLGTAPTQ